MQTRNSLAVAVAVAITAMFLSIAIQPAKAAIITWGSPVTISGVSDVNTTGTLFASANFASASSATVNGVTFDAFPITVGGTSATVGNISVLGSGTGFLTGTLNTTANPYAALPTEYKNLLGPALRMQGVGNSLQFSISNLTIGATYSVQYWVNDPRSGNQAASMVNVGTGVLSVNSTGTAGGVGQWILGQFVADATTQTFSASPNTLTTTYANAMQVRFVAIPEPATWAMAWVGVAVAATCGEIRRRGRTLAARDRKQAPPPGPPAEGRQRTGPGNRRPADATG